MKFLMGMKLKAGLFSLSPQEQAPMREYIKDQSEKSAWSSSQNLELPEILLLLHSSIALHLGKNPSDVPYDLEKIPEFIESPLGELWKKMQKEIVLKNWAKNLTHAPTQEFYEKNFPQYFTVDALADMIQNNKLPSKNSLLYAIEKCQDKLGSIQIIRALYTFVKGSSATVFDTIYTKDLIRVLKPRFSQPDLFDQAVSKLRVHKDMVIHSCTDWDSLWSYNLKEFLSALKKCGHKYQETELYHRF
jgi:hypothetical protein